MNLSNIKLYGGLMLTLLMLSVVSSPSVYSQSYAYLSIEEGLSQATVNTVAQDHDGYIWIGTQDGLNRYDGYKFVRFHHKPDDPKSLSHSFINKVIIDENGLIWILTANGVDRFDASTESFIRYKDKKFNKEFFERLHLWSMRNGRDNHLWILTENGLIKLNKESGKYRHFPSGEEFGLTAKNTYASVIRKFSSNIVTSDSGIFYQSNSKENFSLYPLKHLTNSSSEPRIYCASNVVANTFLMCSRNGIYYFYKNEFHYISNQELGIDSQSSKILLTQNNEILIGTVNGLYFKKFDLDFLPEALKEKGQVSLVDNKINTLFEDRDNVIWVGTETSGVYKIQPAARAFVHFSANSKASNRLFNNLVISIKESDNGEVWVGDSRGGISIFNNEDNIRYLSVINEQGQKLFHSILDIEFDQQHNAWVTNALGVTKFNSQGKQLETIYLEDPSLTQQTYATQLLRSDDGRIWAIGLESGLNLYHFEEKRFIPVRPVNWPPDEPFAKLTSVAIVDGSLLWFGSYQGVLYCYDLSTRKASQFVTADKDNPKLAITHIYGIDKDSHNRLWISGMGGIGFLDLETERFTHIHNQGVLTSETHYSAMSDNAGFVWTTLADKLIRIDSEDYKTIAFERSMGLPIIEFSSAAIQDSKGRFWFGGINGLTRFDPLEIIYPHSDVKPRLTRMERKTNRPSAEEQNLWLPIKDWLNKDLILEPSVNTLRFSFSVLNFTQNSSIRYRYRLLGYENSWNSTRPGVPEAVYTKIPGGEYRLQVAISFDGVNWSKAEDVSHFILEPYFWHTYWFKALAIAVVLFLIYSFAKLKLYQIKQKALKLEKLVAQRTDEISRLLEQRTRFFTFVSHELKTPLTLVQDPLYRLQKNIKWHDNETQTLLSTASRNANRLSVLVERLLKLSTEQVDSTETHSVSFDNVVKNCVSQLAEFASTSKVSLVLQRNDVSIINCNSNDIEIIVYNLLSNAIKHNRSGGKVFIRCYSCNGYIVFSVSDQGKGFSDTKMKEQRDRSLVGGGYGLSLANQSASLLRGKIKVRVRENIGSMFCTIIPCNHTDLTQVISPVLRQNPHQVNSESIEGRNTFLEKARGPKSKAHVVADNNQLSQNTHELLSKGEDLNEHKNILMIVEDNQELREYLCEIFSDNYYCIPAENAELAMKLAVDNIPCIIISDVVLPGVSGIQFCQQLKSNQETCHIPILLLTARDDQESRIYGLRHQATDYLTKPFNSEELKLRIANLLKLTQQRYENNGSVNLNNLYIDDSNTPPGLGEKDKRFMRRFVEVLASKYADSDYNLEQLCLDLYMSKKQLSRKLKAISGKSPMEYLKEYRLEQAVKFLIRGTALSSVAAEAGFSSQSYFSTCFKKHFGVTPKQYQTNAISQSRQSKNNHASL